MTERIVSALLVGPWLTATTGWAAWVATYAVITPWRFLP